MDYLHVLLIIIVIGLVGLVISYRKSNQKIKKQLERVIEGISQAPIRHSGSSKATDELVDEINQLIFRLNDIESQYSRLSNHQKQLIAALSHDMRTPLTAILGYVQLYKQNQNPHYLEIIDQRAMYLNQLIEEFYLLSLIDSNEYVLNLSEFNPLDELREQIALNYHELNDTFEAIDIDIPEENILIESDRLAFNRILSNLIKNTLVHGKDKFSVRSKIDDESIEIRFENKLSENHKIDIDKVFDRAYKGDEARNIQSSGLGLSIVDNLVSQLNGEITAELEGNKIVFILIFKH